MTFMENIDEKGILNLKKSLKGERGFHSKGKLFCVLVVR
jgi:hypothetical protein